VLGGGDGIDTVSYADRSSGVTIALGSRGNGAELEDDVIAADIENAIGGAGPDTITGSDSPNTLDGGDGGDVITGFGGVDVFRAGEGNDLVKAVDGLGESVDCGGGTDTIEPDPADALTSCEVLPTVSPFRPDSDGDTFFDDQDCAPSNPAIRPGAVEIPGNAVDENCDRLTPDFPVLNTLVTVFADFDTRRGALITGLLVRAIPTGGRVRITCKPPRGKRCPFRRAISRTFPQGRSRINFKSSFKGRRLPVGTVLQVRVTKADMIGKVRIETIRPRGFRSQTLCVRPGATRTIRCPT
jgi:hypothetical protein